MFGFTIEELLLLHFKLIEDFGGSHGIRDERRLLSVVAAVDQESFGQQLYPTIYDKAAVYIRNIIGDHPFVDGNKRAGITAGSVFLIRNGLTLTATPKQLEDFAVQVAVEHIDVPNIAAWLRSFSSKK